MVSFVQVQGLVFDVVEVVIVGVIFEFEDDIILIDDNVDDLFIVVCQGMQFDLVNVNFVCVNSVDWINCQLIVSGLLKG